MPRSGQNEKKIENRREEREASGRIGPTTLRRWSGKASSSSPPSVGGSADEPAARWRAGDGGPSSPLSVGGLADEPAARWLAGDGARVSGYQDTFIPSILRTAGRIRKTLGVYLQKWKVTISNRDGRRALESGRPKVQKSSFL
jgi:hypothetical protein